MEPFCSQCRPVSARWQASNRREEDHRELLRRLTAAPSVDPNLPGFFVERTLPESTGCLRLPDGRLGFWATDPPAIESFITQLCRLVITLGRESLATDASPSATLARWNATLMGLRLDPPVMLGAIVGWVDADGNLQMARAGLPAPILRRGQTAEALSMPGPYLGSYEAEFPTIAVRLETGDELHLPGMMLRFTACGGASAIKASGGA